LKTAILSALAGLILMTAGVAQAKPHSSRHRPQGRIEITIDLARHTLQIDKATSRGQFHLTGWTLPVVNGSLHPGVYHPTQLWHRYRTVNGNAYLENVIFFDGARAIRTTRLFNRLKQEGRPVSGQVVLEADLGMIIYQTVQAYGRNQTVIRVQ
jgi:hypothetical protein